jgi:hypothetical protein
MDAKKKSSSSSNKKKVKVPMVRPGIKVDMKKKSSSSSSDKKKPKGGIRSGMKIDTKKKSISSSSSKNLKIPIKKPGVIISPRAGDAKNFVVKSPNGYFSIAGKDINIPVKDKFDVPVVKLMRKERKRLADPVSKDTSKYQRKIKFFELKLKLQPKEERKSSESERNNWLS